MNDKAKETGRKYLKLRDEVDNLCNKLHKIHKKYTNCKLDCDECCMNFRLLPVEFHSILWSVKEFETGINNDPNPESCPFLLNHSCSIYQTRPIICRSHGLPILDMDSEGEDWELSFCPLNFKTASDEYFTHKNCYSQDSINSKLYLLNLEFIGTFDEIKYERDEMIDLSRFRELL
jgi:Fe-S-cluster containining protein